MTRFAARIDVSLGQRDVGVVLTVEQGIDRAGLNHLMLVNRVMIESGAGESTQVKCSDESVVNNGACHGLIVRAPSLIRCDQSGDLEPDLIGRPGDIGRYVQPVRATSQVLRREGEVAVATDRYG